MTRDGSALEPIEPPWRCIALDAVTGTLTMEVVPLHHAGESTALGQADQIDAFDLAQNRQFDFAADLKIVLFTLSAKLADVTLGLAVGLGDGGLAELRPAASGGAP